MYIILHRGSLLSEVIVEVLTVNVRQVAGYSRAVRFTCANTGGRTKFGLNRAAAYERCICVDFLRDSITRIAHIYPYIYIHRVDERGMELSTWWRGDALGTHCRSLEIPTFRPPRILKNPEGGGNETKRKTRSKLRGSARRLAGVGKRQKFFHAQNRKNPAVEEGRGRGRSGRGQGTDERGEEK